MISVNLAGMVLFLGIVEALRNLGENVDPSRSRLVDSAVRESMRPTPFAKATSMNGKKAESIILEHLLLATRMTRLLIRSDTSRTSNHT